MDLKLAYFPMRARSSGVKEVVYLLAFLHSLSAARLSLPCSPLGVRWETAAFGLPLVGSSWVWPDFAQKKNKKKNVFRAKSGHAQLGRGCG